MPRYPVPITRVNEKANIPLKSGEFDNKSETFRSALAYFDSYISFCNTLVSVNDYQELNRKFNHDCLTFFFVYLFLPLYVAFTDGIDGVPFPLNIFFKKRQKKKVVPIEVKVNKASKNLEVKKKKVASLTAKVDKLTALEELRKKYAIVICDAPCTQKQYKRKEKRRKRLEKKRVRKAKELEKLLSDARSKEAKQSEQVRILLSKAGAKAVSLSNAKKKRFLKRAERYQEVSGKHLPIEKLFWGTLSCGDLYGYDEFSKSFSLSGDSWYTTQHVRRFSSRPEERVDLQKVLEVVKPKMRDVGRVQEILDVAYETRVPYEIRSKWHQILGNYVYNGTDYSPLADNRDTSRLVDRALIQSQYKKLQYGFFIAD